MECFVSQYIYYFVAIPSPSASKNYFQNFPLQSTSLMTVRVDVCLCAVLLNFHKSFIQHQLPGYETLVPTVVAVSLP